MKFGVLGALLAFFLFVTGCTRMKESFAFTNVQVADLAQFIKAPKREGWVRLTDVYLRTRDLTYVATANAKAKEREEGGGAEAFDWVGDVYVPAHTGPEDATSGPARLLVARNDPELLAMVDKMDDGDAKAAEDLANAKDIGPVSIEGMISGAEEIGEAKELKELNIAANALVIRQDQKPRHWSIGLIMIGGALAIFGSILVPFMPRLKAA